MMIIVMMMMMMIIAIITRSPPAPVEPWLRGTRLPAGKQTGPAAVAANIQYLGIFHFLKVFCICQTFNISYFLYFATMTTMGRTPELGRWMGIANLATRGELSRLDHLRECQDADE